MAVRIEREFLVRNFVSRVLLVNAYTEMTPMRTKFVKRIKMPNGTTETGSTCPLCGGEGILLGLLALMKHFRCRNCGCMWSKEKRVKKDWFS